MTLWVGSSDGGRVVEGDALVVRADDHGLVVGDGVFETAKVIDGRVFARTRHLARLRASAAGLGLEYDETVLQQGIDAVVDASHPRQRLRITVTGGPSPYGSSRGESPATLLVATTPLAEWPATDDVVIVPWTRNERGATAGLKTTSYADNVIALRRAHERGAAEAILANTLGQLCEGTGSNVFVAVEGRLVTPPLASGCLAGITRDLVVEWLDVEERDLPLGALRRAEEAFLTSSTRDVQPIRAVDGVPLAAAPGPLTEQAMTVFAKRAAETDDP